MPYVIVIDDVFAGVPTEKIVELPDMLASLGEGDEVILRADVPGGTKVMMSTRIEHIERLVADLKEAKARRM